MFRFVYALGADEPADAKWAADGFVGIESAQEREGLPRVGVRNLPPDSNGLSYVIHPPAGAGETPVQFGQRLREAADRFGEAWVLVESGGAFRTPQSLWLLMEDTRHDRVKVAVDIDAVVAAGVRPSVLVPTLNLRIGLVRARTPGEAITTFARRLAGIGFGGYVVIDPPAGPDRATAANELVTQFRSIFPTKPVKKVPAKVG